MQQLRPRYRTSTDQAGRGRHRCPKRPVLGELRLDERTDARLALSDWRRSAAAATALGMTPGRQECRAYRCRDCNGWHLTSQTARQRRASDLAQRPTLITQSRQASRSQHSLLPEMKA